jgi:hypothetical protein
MSRKLRRSAQSNRVEKRDPFVFRFPGWQRVALFVLNLPRPIRMIVTGIFALAVTLSLSPLIDEVYLRYLFDPSTRVLPSLVSVGFGLVMYALGWWWVIGTIGERPPVRRMVFAYTLIGIGAVVVVLVLLAQGYTIGNAPTE